MCIFLPGSGGRMFFEYIHGELVCLQIIGLLNLISYTPKCGKLSYINTPVIYWTHSNMKTIFIDLIVIVICQ